MKYYGNELYHHGILGQKWGVRNYQNEDGSLTPAGRERYSDDTPIGRKKNVTGTAVVKKRGDGLNTGPVGKRGNAQNSTSNNGKKASPRHSVNAEWTARDKADYEAAKEIDDEMYLKANKDGSHVFFCVDHVYDIPPGRSTQELTKSIQTYDKQISKLYAKGYDLSGRDPKASEAENKAFMAMLNGASPDEYMKYFDELEKEREEEEEEEEDSEESTKSASSSSKPVSRKKYIAGSASVKKGTVVVNGSKVGKR